MDISLARASIAVLAVATLASCQPASTPAPTTADSPTSPTVSLELPPPSAAITPPPALAEPVGEYTVIFRADSSCSQLPVSVRTRTYISKISSADGRFYKAELSGSDFFFRYGIFYVSLMPGAAKFWVYSLYARNAWLEEQPIFERLTDGGYLSLSGTAEVPMQNSDASLSARFDGAFTYCPLATEHANPDAPPSCPNYIDCTSRNHSLTLTRR